MDKKNNIRQFREKLLMSKAELARKAGLSALTIDRIEKGMKCRMDTKRNSFGTWFRDRRQRSNFS